MLYKTLFNSLFVENLLTSQPTVFGIQGSILGIDSNFVFHNKYF